MCLILSVLFFITDYSSSEPISRLLITLRIASKQEVTNPGAYEAGMWEHGGVDGGGLQGIWNYDARPVPPPEGWWDELGEWMNTFHL